MQLPRTVGKAGGTRMPFLFFMFRAFLMATAHTLIRLGREPNRVDIDAYNELPKSG